MIQEVAVGEHTLKFAIFNQACKWRADTLLTKEPCTIDWLNELGPDDVLWDCGACIGGYTIYAAVTRRCRVVAFEPLVSNLYALTANVGINNVQDLVQILPVALSDRNAVDTLYCSSLEIGSSCHSAGAELSPSLQPKNTKGKQTVLLMRGDTAANLTGPPTAVKEDTDGLDHLVIAGLSGIMRNIRTICIETNSLLREHTDMVQYLLSSGFEWSEEQYAKAQRTEGAFKGTGEAVFRRAAR